VHFNKTTGGRHGFRVFADHAGNLISLSGRCDEREAISNLVGLGVSKESAQEAVGFARRAGTAGVNRDR
jgi:hypothetical protein